jgi:hypothetical protein
VGGASAEIYWLTDSPATSGVEFGPTTVYGAAAGDETTLSTVHRVTLLALSPSSLYHYRVRSHDPSGNTLYSYDRSFRTSAPGVAASSLGFLEGFEGSGAAAWTVQTYIDSQAVTASGTSSNEAHGGLFSLQLTADLRGGDVNKSKGEVYASFNQFPGSSQDFLNLNGKTVSAWVDDPSGTFVDGSIPNGIQIFVKDASYRSQYGPWTPVAGTGWFQAFMVVGGGGNAFTDTGFDPTQIISCGVKIGTGGGSTGNYTGSLYVDDVEVNP